MEIDRPMNRMKPLCILTCVVLSHHAWADYPIVSHRYLADPGALVYDRRVYLYCSNDDDNLLEEKSGYRMRSIVCVSSIDLKNWTDHGIVLRVPEDASWATNSWAPSPVQRDGKVFVYFGNAGQGIGVAVANGPLGPFKDPIGKELVGKDTPGVLPPEDMWIFDPMAFVDDDGQAYLYFGGNGDDNLRAIKLNRDMIRVDGPAIRLSAVSFFEASWMHKYNGTYYFSYSTRPKAKMRIDYMTSKSPVAGFTYRGIVSHQPPLNGNNNHHSIFEFEGVWYEAYHNRIVARQANVPHTYRRNLCIDRIRHKDDGTIEIMQNTEDGLPQLSYVNPFERVEAETMNAQKGIETEACSEGGLHVCDIEEGDWIKVRGVDFGPVGADAFSARVVSSGRGGKMELRLGSPSGEWVGTCDVSSTDGNKNWKTVSCSVKETKGIQDLYLVFTGSSKSMFNLDWWKFASKNSRPGDNEE